MNDTLLLLAIMIIGAAIWHFAKPPAVFVVRVRGGNVEATRGKVTTAFLDVVTEVCREFAIESAEVRGVTRGRRISLQFSSQLPSAARQRLRNWWVLSGWPAPHFTRPRR